MRYIFLDESDKVGTYFSNFYGGLMVDSKYLDEFISRIYAIIESCGLVNEEIKWQKVNAYTFEKYKIIIDELFTLLKEGKAKIRIFFRHNKYVAIGLTNKHIDEEYTIFYYQFIKHAFGLNFAPASEDNRLQLLFDEMPINQSHKAKFKSYLLSLFNSNEFNSNGVLLTLDNIREVDSKKHLPLQVMDVVLGAICFRLNDKHKQKDPNTGKRGKRTILKEKLYKHILTNIRSVTYEDFNIGLSTRITNLKDKWFYPYLHWRFVPTNSFVDESLSKHQQ